MCWFRKRKPEIWQAKACRGRLVVIIENMEGFDVLKPCSKKGKIIQDGQAIKIRNDLLEVYYEHYQPA